MRALLVWCLVLTALPARAEPPVVAVFDLEDAAATPTIPRDVALQLGDYLEGRLAESGTFRVVPKDQLRAQLASAKKQSYQSCFDDACQIEVGKALAAQKTLSTKLMRLGKQCILKSVLYDLEKEVSEAVANVKGGCTQDDLVTSVEAVAEKLRLARDPSGSAPLASPIASESPAPKASPTGHEILDSLALPETRRTAPRLTVRGLDTPPRKPVSCKTPEACYDLGADHQAGRNGSPQDDARALELFRVACKGGHAAACVDVGYHIEMGRGTPVDLANAAAYYQRGCDGGNQIGCANLAFMFENGRGVTADLAIARELYRGACDGGNGRGCTSLGYMLENGSGVEVDLTRSAQLYKQGCGGGNMTGCANYAYMLSNARGVAQDDDAAFRYYKQACDGAEARGCTDMGFMYENGRGVGFDLVKAVRHYEQGCTMGNAFGCERAGKMHETGRGTVKDKARAQALYRQACDGGEDKGCKGLERLR